MEPEAEVTHTPGRCDGCPISVLHSLGHFTIPCTLFPVLPLPRPDRVSFADPTGMGCRTALIQGWVGARFSEVTANINESPE